MKDPDKTDIIARAIRRAAEHSIAYQEQLEERTVFPEPGAIRALEELDVSLNEEPMDAADVLDMLHRTGSPATVAEAGGRYFGFVIGGSLPAALGANMLATSWDQCAGLEIASPATFHLERICNRYLNEILGLPVETAAGFVTGATMANFTGLASARHALLKKEGWNVGEDGLFGAPPITVITGDEVHASLLKALTLLGLGRNRIIRVPTDEQGRMIPGKIPEITGPTILCIQAGNVNTGAFDPAAEIFDKIGTGKAWVHVDGAFGLWAKASASRKHLAEGFERADSWAVDAHKWLNVPYDSGIVLVKDPLALTGAMSISAAYLIQGEMREPYNCVPEFSRRGRGVDIWAALRSLGRKGLADMIDRNCDMARHFANRLENAGARILNEVALNQVLVSFGTAEDTREVIRKVQQDGTCWCGGTEWQGHTAMRISVSSWRTTLEDVDRSADAIIRIMQDKGR